MNTKSTKYRTGMSSLSPIFSSAAHYTQQLKTIMDSFDVLMPETSKIEYFLSGMGIKFSPIKKEEQISDTIFSEITHRTSDPSQLRHLELEAEYTISPDKTKAVYTITATPLKIQDEKYTLSITCELDRQKTPQYALSLSKQTQDGDEQKTETIDIKKICSYSHLKSAGEKQITTHMAQFPDFREAWNKSRFDLPRTSTDSIAPSGV